MSTLTFTGGASFERRRFQLEAFRLFPLWLVL